MRRLVTRTALAGAVLAGGLSLSPPVDAAPAEWSVTQLQPLPGDQYAEVLDINDAGISVGRSDLTPVTWDANGVPTALPLPDGGCHWSFFAAIGDSGHVVAPLSCQSGFVTATWSPERVLTTTPARLFAEAVDANGIAVGFVEPEEGDQAVAYLAPHPLLELPDVGAESQAFDLTDWGYVVGALRDVPTLPEWVAVGWYGDQVFPLLNTTLPSGAISVNESGVALVLTWESTDLSEGQRGYLVAPGGRVTALDASGLTDRPLDLNDHGIVVGTKDPWHPEAAGVFYVGSQLVRFDDIVSAEDAAEFDLSEPRALNNGAWVVGNTPDDRGWLLRPPAA